MEVLDLQDPALERELSLEEEMEELSALIKEVPARIPTRPLPVRRQVQVIDPLPNRPSPSQVDRLPEEPEGSHIEQAKPRRPRPRQRKRRTVHGDAPPLIPVGEYPYEPFIPLQIQMDLPPPIPSLPLLLPPGFHTFSSPGRK